MNGDINLYYIVYSVSLVLSIVNVVQIFYFKMPEGVNVVTVDVATDSKRCAIVSVQNKTVSFVQVDVSD